ncbi:cobaltochelatase CobT-related protein [Candidatus Lokiarchaeum ossiferum]|uniref:cobaltochelatase CobT-related protein n=1 Tax=Candidatus Lokiarchaeum ossiferum TaxID=2951803 RepID=UPI00352E75C0
MEIITSKNLSIHRTLSLKERTLIENVARRVSDLSTCNICLGAPCTDGKNIFLPFNDSSLSYYDLEALAAHEGGHIRFKSLIDPKLSTETSPKMPELGQIVLNICEDARIEYLLKLTFPGFWEELNVLNARFCMENLVQASELDVKNLRSEKMLNFLLNLTSLIGCENEDYIYSHFLREDGFFKFGSQSMKYFWIDVKKAICFVRKERSFLSSIIASKKIILAIENYLKKRILEYSKSNDNRSNNSGSVYDGDTLKITKRSASGLTEKKSNKKQTSTSKQENIESDPLSFDKLNEFLKKKKKNLSSSKLNGSKSSGIPITKLNSKERNMIETLIKELTEKECVESPIIDEITYKFKTELKYSHEAIESILQEMKSFKKSPATSIFEEKKRILVEGNIKMHVVSNKDELKKLNGIHSPEKSYQNIRSTYFPIIYKLRSKLAPIKQSQSLIRGQRRGYISGRDLSQVKASRGNFNRPFKRKQLSRGAQLILLIDESGSMRGSRIKMAKSAAIIIAEALKNTKIDFSIIGFGAKSSQMIICEKIYKDFRESPNSEKIGSIGISNQFIQNRDGTSFRMAVERRILKFGPQIPILIILSDGEPCHGGTSYCGQHAIIETKKSVEDILRKKIKVFALSIDSHGGSYLEAIYGKDRFQIVENLAELPNKLIKLVSNIAKALI